MSREGKLRASSGGACLGDQHTSSGELFLCSQGDIEYDWAIIRASTVDSASKSLRYCPLWQQLESHLRLCSDLVGIC